MTLQTRNTRLDIKDLSSESDIEHAKHGVEEIESNMLDMSVLVLPGQHHHHKKYTMEKVPLRVGVLINPDEILYDKDAVDTYKHAAKKLHDIHE